MLKSEEEFLKENGHYKTLIERLSGRLNEFSDEFERNEFEMVIDELKKTFSKIDSAEIGKTFTPFYDKRNKIGRCFRIELSEDGIYGGEMEQAFINAQNAVMNFLKTHFIRVNKNIGIRVIRDKCGRILDGSSIGLSFAIMMLSRYFTREIPNNLSFSAAIEDDGTLRAVDYFAEKLKAAAEYRGQITVLFASEDQEVTAEEKKARAVTVKRVSNLDGAVREIWGEEYYKKYIIPEIENVKKKYEALLFYKKLQEGRQVLEIADELIADLQESEKYHDRTILVYAYAEKGLQNTHESRLNDAFYYFNKAKEELERLGNNADPAIPFYDIFTAYGIYLIDVYKYEQAEKEFKVALDFLNSRNFPEYYKIKIWNSLAQLRYRQGNFSEAVRLLAMSLKTMQGSDYDDSARIFCYFAESYILAGAFEQAAHYLDKADKNSGKKENQRFYNDFYRLMLLFRQDKKDEFLALFDRFDYWNEHKQRSSIHLAMVYAWRASFYGENEYKRRAFDMLYREDDIFTTLLLLKVEAMHRLRGGKSLFFEMGQIADLIKQAAGKAEYLKKNLQGVNKFAKADWIKIEKTLNF